MAPRRKTISVSILDIKDAGTAARKDVRADPKDTDGSKVIDYALGLKKTSLRSGTGKDVTSPKDLPTNAISFCYSADSDTDCTGLGGRPGTVFDFSSLGNTYRTQLFSTYMSSDLYLRSQNGDSSGAWNPWVRLYHTGNKPTPKEIGAGTYAGMVHFDGTSGTWTTDEFIAFIKSLGVISTGNYESWSASGSWSYANNKMVNTAGAGDVGHISLAGSLIEVVGTSSNYIIRVTTPTTTPGGFAQNGASREFVYINNGSTYAPGWRASYNTANKPQPTDIGTTAATGNTLAMRDSSGDIHCRLVRAEYANQDVISGAMAFRVNNSSDNYIRFCSNPAAIRAWLSLDTGNTPTFAQTINTYTRAFRTVGGKFGTFWHNDGGDNLYLMFTNANDQYGSWSNLRPMHFNMTTGAALFSHGVSSPVGFHLPANVSLTFNASASWASGIGWGIQEEGATGNLMFHRYSSNVWQNAPLRIQNDSTLFCEGNGNFNDVYIRSDIRDKRKLKYIDNPLERVGEMCGAMYEVEDFHGWKQSVGLIAQHVKNGLPEAVNIDKNFRDQPRYRVNYNGVVGLLVNCVNVLNGQLKVTADQLKNLREDYDELKTQVNLCINT